jgi:folate-binding Fe-S cluster repair protein YgfZ
MDFFKGCYIGQEVLSRIKTTGKMPREMIAFEAETTVNVGDEICTDKAVGTVTSVTMQPVTGYTVGLGMARQGAVGSDLTVSGTVLRRR